MIVVALHFRLRLLEADVVEAGKRGSVDVFDGVIGHQKVLLPAHELVVAALQAIVVKVVRIERFLKVGAERREFALHTFRSNATGSLVSSDLWHHHHQTHPVLAVDVLVGVPLARKERILARDDLTVEEGGEHRVFGRQAGDL